MGLGFQSLKPPQYVPYADITSFRLVDEDGFSCSARQSKVDVCFYHDVKAYAAFRFGIAFLPVKSRAKTLIKITA